MFKILTFETLDSTNSYAKEHLLSLDNKHVIFTTNQLKGKGRENREWISSSNSLTFSIILKDSYSINNFSTISLLAASAVFKTLNKYVKKDLTIKWPNDIYYKNSKISGILLESISYGENIEGIIVGIGINLNNLNEELSVLENNAISLYQITNNKYDKLNILKELLNNIEELLLETQNNSLEYLNIIRENNYLKDKLVVAKINNKEEYVKVIDIQENNKLLVNSNNNLIELYTDEITFNRKTLG